MLNPAQHFIKTLAAQKKQSSLSITRPAFFPSARFAENAESTFSLVVRSLFFSRLSLTCLVASADTASAREREKSAESKNPGARYKSSSDSHASARRKQIIFSTVLMRAIYELKRKTSRVWSMTFRASYRRACLAYRNLGRFWMQMSQCSSCALVRKKLCGRFDFSDAMRLVISRYLVYSILSNSSNVFCVLIVIQLRNSSISIKTEENDLLCYELLV